MAGGRTPQAATAARRRTGLLPEHFPVRRVILVVLSIVIIGGVAIGSFKTFTLPPGERPGGPQWRDLFVFGVAQGSVYALIAIGYSLVYGILLMINFAHGEVFMAGAFSSLFVLRTLESNGFYNRNPILSILLMLLTAMLVSTGIAMLLERVAYRPLRGAPRLVPLITAIGASLFLQNTFKGFFGADSKGYPRPDALNGLWHPFGVPVQRSQLLVIIAAAVALVALSWFVARTTTGKSMRAVAEDKEIASLMGINVDRVIVVTFAIGGLLAGIAGVLYAMVFQQVKFDMGFLPGIKAFTAAVLGGIGSISGAAIGGLILGVLESVGPTLFLSGAGVPSSFQLKDVIAFLILVVVLIFRPGGILGTGEPEKV
jgi:branched-chain amino acid transport system permease protein